MFSLAVLRMESTRIKACLLVLDANDGITC